MDAMKSIFLAFIMLIVTPYYAVSASFEDIKGYWLSEDDWPVIGHKVTLIITDDTLRHRKMKPKKFSVINSDNVFIIKFDSYKKLGKKTYNDMHEKIVIINENKIIREMPASSGSGSRKQWIYNRITEEEAQKYLR